MDAFLNWIPKTPQTNFKFSSLFCITEIPLFHVLNARVTFSNLCGCDEPVSSVTVHQPEDTGEAGSCAVFSTSFALF